MPPRKQLALLLSVVVLLTAIIVTVTAYWFDRPTTLTISVGPPNSPEHRFADKLAGILKQNRASIRLEVIAHDTYAQALGRFFRREADLTIVRTDAKIPSHARSVAILEHEMLLLIGPKTAKIKSMADLSGKKVAVLGDDGRNEALVRQILDLYEINRGKTILQTQATTTAIDKLLIPGGYDFIITLDPLSRITKTKTYEELADRMHGFTLFGVSDSNAMERKVRGLSAETIDAGLLSGSPRIPDEDMNTVALQKLLVARNKLPDQNVADLMRNLFENKNDLSIDQQFATKIEPPDLEKDSYITAHEGSSQYVERAEKSFLDRYSDILYLTMSVGSVVGSLGIAVFTSLTRVKPRKASERTDDLLEITEKIRTAEDINALDIAETELEDLLNEVLRGLKDRTLSSDGLEAFRLGYEHARHALVLRRRHLTLTLPPNYGL